MDSINSNSTASVLAEVCWDDGYAVPVADAENKELEGEVRAGLRPGEGRGIHLPSAALEDCCHLTGPSAEGGDDALPLSPRLGTRGGTELSPPRPGCGARGGRERIKTHEFCGGNRGR